MVNKNNIIAGGIFCLALVLRFFRLDSVPGEFYGDIAIIYDLTKGILHWQFPYFFVLSNGPLYGYIIAPLIALFGEQGYLPYKIASVVVSLFAILFTYLLAQQLANRKTALIAAFLMATSSWYLVFSRLGNAPVIIPVLTAASFYCLAHAHKTKKFGYMVLGGLIAGLGWYEMPQTFFLPVIYSIVALTTFPWKKNLVLAGLLILMAIPFLGIVNSERDLFFAGYIGGKFNHQTPSMAIAKVADNTRRSLGMLHLQGDGTFRNNPPKKPQLDLLSGLFFLIGIGFVVIKKKKLMMLLIFPFLALQLPSILVLSEELATPNASRTIGILPFIMVLTAMGITASLDYIKNIQLQKVLLILGLGTILSLNSFRYFVEYANALPNKNTPIGKMIATDIDNTPLDVKVVVLGSGWGEWGQPEISGIMDVVQKKQPLIVQDPVGMCPDAIFPGQKFYTAISPVLYPLLEHCFTGKHLQTHLGYDGTIIYYSYKNY